MKIEIKQNQSIWDIAVQYTGDSGNALSILFKNDKKNSTLMIGEELVIPSELISKRHIEFFQDKNIGTAHSSSEPEGDLVTNQKGEFMLNQENENMQIQE